MSFFENESYQALRNSLDASWMQQKVHSNNIANSETPGYKAKQVSFQKVLAEAADGKTSRLEQQAVISEDRSTASRPDGNNVNTEKEEMDMWQAYAQYSTVSQRISGKLKNLQYVINNAGK